MVQLNEAEKYAKVVVPDDKLSLAIGKNGQNARLAAKLTGYRIDVKPYSEVMAELEASDGEDGQAETARQRRNPERAINEQMDPNADMRRMPQEPA